MSFAQMQLASDDEEDDHDFQPAKESSPSDSDEESILKPVSKSTINVNDVWADMNSTTIKPSSRINLKDFAQKAPAAPQTKVYEFAGVKINPDTLKEKPKEVVVKKPKLFLDLRLAQIAKKYGVKGLDPTLITKLTTLEKSKLDWFVIFYDRNKHVEQEGIKVDLARGNKDGYMERVAFLNRTDARQAEQIALLKSKTKRRIEKR